MYNFPEEHMRDEQNYGIVVFDFYFHYRKNYTYIYVHILSRKIYIYIYIMYINDIIGIFFVDYILCIVQFSDEKEEKNCRKNHGVCTYYDGSG